MRVELQADGLLKVMAETEVEAYALRCWAKETTWPTKGKLMVDASTEEERRKREEGS